MRLLFLLACAVALLRGQQFDRAPRQQVLQVERPAVELARQWIKDVRPLYRAWAAALILEHRQQWVAWNEVVAALGDEAQLRDLQPLATDREPLDDNDRMRLAILDTLIQTQVSVPPEISRLLVRRYPAQAVILLYQGGCPNPAVGREVFRTVTVDEAWLVSGKCLAGQTGGMVELLQDLRVTAEVNVFDRGFGEGGGGVLGGAPGEIPADPAPPNWPELHSYELVSYWPRVGVTMLSAGRFPIYYYRQSGALLWRQPNYSEIHGHRAEYLCGLIAEALYFKPESMPIKAQRSVQLQWTTPEQYRSDLRALAAEQERGYEEVLSQAIRRSLLTESERDGCHLAMEIDVVDRRSDQRQALPIVGVGDHIRER